MCRSISVPTFCRPHFSEAFAFSQIKEPLGRCLSASIDSHLLPAQNNSQAKWHIWRWYILAPYTSRMRTKILLLCCYSFINSDSCLSLTHTQVLSPLNSANLADSALSLTSSQGLVCDDLYTDNLLRVP